VRESREPAARLLEAWSDACLDAAERRALGQTRRWMEEILRTAARGGALLDFSHYSQYACSPTRHGHSVDEVRRFLQFCTICRVGPPRGAQRSRDRGRSPAAGSQPGTSGVCERCSGERLSYLLSQEAIAALLPAAAGWITGVRVAERLFGGRWRERAVRGVALGRALCRDRRP